MIKDVDPKEVWRILHDKVDDFEKYITQVGAYIGSEGRPTTKSPTEDSVPPQ